MRRLGLIFLGSVLACAVPAGARAQAANPIFAEALGGTGEDTARDVATDPDGNLVAVGGTASPDFVTTPGAYDRTPHGLQDVWVAKFDRTGRLLFSTRIGGPGHDRAYAVEVAANGDIVIAGRAGRGFPTTPGVVQPGFGGDLHPNSVYGEQDGFVARLSGDGARLLWATYFGGPDDGIVRDLALSPDGGIVVGGGVQEPGPYVHAGAPQAAIAGGRDGIVAKLSGDGARVEWATYLGGSGDEVGQPSVRVDASGAVTALFVTRSSDVPTTPGALQRRAGGGLDDFLLARIARDGSRFEAVTYFGGSGNESFETHNLALGADGSVVIAASTSSVDLPTTPGAVQPRFGGGTSAFGADGVVARLSADLSRLLGCTYLGGSGDDGFEGVIVDAEGYVVASGNTASDDFPTTPGAPRRQSAGAHDAVIVRLPPDLGRLDFSTRIGGSGDDIGRALADAGGGVVSLGGITDSAAFPRLGGAAAGQDVLLARVRVRLDLEAATLIAPSGTVFTSQPAFQWSAVANATRYQLYVSTADGSVAPIVQWLDASEAGCAGTATCQVDAGIALGNGSYRFWVQTWNASGAGPWSAPEDFVVIAPLRTPAATDVVAPSGRITSALPIFTWNAVATASWYQLYVGGADGSVPIVRWARASEAGCGAGTGSCSFDPLVELSNGAYTIWVQTWNAQGDGPWSAPRAFVVDAPTTVPQTPTPTGPVGVTGSARPLYGWSAVSNASWYQLYVGHPDESLVVARWVRASEAGCRDGASACSFDLGHPLVSGDYRFWVQGWNAHGSGRWSAPADFRVP